MLKFNPKPETRWDTKKLCPVDLWEQILQQERDENFEFTIYTEIDKLYIDSSGELVELIAGYKVELTVYGFLINEDGNMMTDTTDKLTK